MAWQTNSTLASAITLANTAGGVALNKIVEDKAQGLIDSWLDLNYTSMGQAAHIAATLASTLLVDQFNGLVRQGEADIPSLIAGDIAKVQSQLQGNQMVNGILALFMQPSIDGIVIVAEQQSCTRQVEVSEDALIMQNLQNTKYVTDNAVPRPRRWELQGKIVTVSWLDAYNILKPSLELQVNTLDNYMKSGRPVMFKQFGMSFVRCIITSFTWSHNAKYRNALDVQISLQEFVPYEVEASIGDAATALLKGAMESI